MLITSNRRQRWTIPKGFVKTGLSPVDPARQEAWKEAGIRGVVSPVSIGCNIYTKRKKILSVAVFPMHVEKIFDVWPEWSRHRHWMSLVEALPLIKAPGLIDIIEKFGAAFSEKHIITLNEGGKLLRRAADRTLAGVLGARISRRVTELK